MSAAGAVTSTGPLCCAGNGSEDGVGAREADETGVGVGADGTFGGRPRFAGCSRRSVNLASAALNAGEPSTQP